MEARSRWQNQCASSSSEWPTGGSSEPSTAEMEVSVLTALLWRAREKVESICASSDAETEAFLAEVDHQRYENNAELQRYEARAAQELDALNAEDKECSALQKEFDRCGSVLLDERRYEQDIMDFLSHEETVCSHQKVELQDSFAEQKGLYEKMTESVVALENLEDEVSAAQERDNSAVVELRALQRSACAQAVNQAGETASSNSHSKTLGFLEAEIEYAERQLKEANYIYGRHRTFIDRASQCLAPHTDLNRTSAAASLLLKRFYEVWRAHCVRRRSTKAYDQHLSRGGPEAVHRAKELLFNAVGRYAHHCFTSCILIVLQAWRLRACSIRLARLAAENASARTYTSKWFPKLLDQMNHVVIVTLLSTVLEHVFLRWRLATREKMWARQKTEARIPLDKALNDEKRFEYEISLMRERHESSKNEAAMVRMLSTQHAGNKEFMSFQVKRSQILIEDLHEELRSSLSCLDSLRQELCRSEALERQAAEAVTDRNWDNRELEMHRRNVLLNSVHGIEEQLENVVYPATENATHMEIKLREARRLLEEQIVPSQLYLKKMRARRVKDQVLVAGLALAASDKAALARQQQQQALVLQSAIDSCESFRSDDDNQPEPLAQYEAPGTFQSRAASIVEKLKDQLLLAHGVKLSSGVLVSPAPSKSLKLPKYDDARELRKKLEEQQALLREETEVNRKICVELSEVEEHGAEAESEVASIRARIARFCAGCEAEEMECEQLRPRLMAAEDTIQTFTEQIYRLSKCSENQTYITQSNTDQRCMRWVAPPMSPDPECRDMVSPNFGWRETSPRDSPR